jgi:cobalamin-dependent methionine synthase I
MENYDLQEIAEYIDWQPFFIAWEMHGKFPAILNDPIIGKEATVLYEDALAFTPKNYFRKMADCKRNCRFLASHQISIG